MMQVTVVFSLVISTREKVFLMCPYIEISWKETYKSRLVEHFVSSIDPKNQKSCVFTYKYFIENVLCENCWTQLS